MEQGEGKKRTREQPERKRSRITIGRKDRDEPEHERIIMADTVSTSSITEGSELSASPDHDEASTGLPPRHPMPETVSVGSAQATGGNADVDGGTAATLVQDAPRYGMKGGVLPFCQRNVESVMIAIILLAVGIVAWELHSNKLGGNRIEDPATGQAASSYLAPSSAPTASFNFLGLFPSPSAKFVPSLATEHPTPVSTTTVPYSKPAKTATLSLTTPNVSQRKESRGRQVCQSSFESSD